MCYSLIRELYLPEMLNNEQGRDEVSDPEFAEHLTKLDELEDHRLDGETYANVTPALNAGDVVKRLSHFNSDWVFRGQRDARWGLTPPIERCAQKGFWSPQESKAYDEFRRRAPAYIDKSKCPASTLGWLATMQHYGGPTRLLDWTEDPYVASLFAVAEADRETDSAVWAINHTAVTKESRRLLSRESHPPATFDSDETFKVTFFRETWPPVIMHVNTTQPSERQKEQKGLFLCSNATQWDYGFETCLRNVLQYCPEHQPRWLCKIVIPAAARDELLADLTRRGVTYERLFPDLGGLGRSLGIIASIRSDVFTDHYPECRSE